MGVSLNGGTPNKPMGLPTKNDHFKVFGGYHHFRKHPYPFQKRHGPLIARSPRGPVPLRCNEHSAFRKRSPSKKKNVDVQQSSKEFEKVEDCWVPSFCVLCFFASHVHSIHPFEGSVSIF